MKRRVVALLGVLVAGPAALASAFTTNGIAWSYHLCGPDYATLDGSETKPTIPATTAGDVEIPETLDGATVREMSSYAFYGCSQIRSIKIPIGIADISDHAFENCSSLVSVDIPESVTNIGTYAFGNCSSLSSVDIPKSVGSVGKCAFYKCVQLNSIKIAHWFPLPYDDGETFWDCDILQNVTIPWPSTWWGDKILGRLGEAITNLTVLYEGNRTFDAGTSRISPSYSSFSERLPNLKSLRIGEGFFVVESGELSRMQSLETVELPSTLTELGTNVFSGCGLLKTVTFRGDAPDVGEGAFFGTPKRMVFSVPEGAVGWNGDLTTAMPAAWQGRQLVTYANDSEGDSGSTGGSDAGGTGGTAKVSTAYALTVTNVVVHYVLNSVQPEIALPISGDTGYVSVITEVTSAGVVSVPAEWKDNYPGFEAKFGTDFGKALMMETGKVDGNGKPMLVWQDYVAGTDPTDPNSTFSASITLVDGKPVVSWTPELSAEQAAVRVYTVYGKVKLQDAEWSVVNGDAADYNFFKVGVEMK